VIIERATPRLVKIAEIVRGILLAERTIDQQPKIVVVPRQHKCQWLMR
jgi:hypothetical protein